MTDTLEEISLFLRRWRAPLLWMGIILFASTDVASTSTSYHLLRPVLKWLNPEIAEPTVYKINVTLRKALHVTQFAILAILVWRAREAKRKAGLQSAFKGVLFVLGIAAVFAGSSEIIQYFMKYRGASFHDVLLDVGGAGLGLILLYLWRRCFKRPEPQWNWGG